VILIPEQIEEWVHYMENDAPKGPEYAETLRAYAEVVQAVAESNVRIDWSGITEGVVVPSDTADRARELRGMA
jgi:hypothetical protein